MLLESVYFIFFFDFSEGIGDWALGIGHGGLGMGHGAWGIGLFFREALYCLL
jgi:hypothetical protein